MMRTPARKRQRERSKGGALCEVLIDFPILVHRLFLEFSSGNRRRIRFAPRRIYASAGSQIYRKITDDQFETILDATWNNKIKLSSMGRYFVPSLSSVGEGAETPERLR
jgi:hypothetical protein